MKITKLLVLVIGITLLASVATSCRDSGSDTTGGSSNGTGSASDEFGLTETSEAASSLFESHDEAAFAILSSADQGYSPFQITEAIHEGNLDEDGDIDGTDPERSAQGQLSSVPLPHYLGLISVAHAEVASEEDLASQFENMSQDQRDEWLVWILGATSEGYSVRQVTEYIEVRTQSDDPSPQEIFGLPILLDADGEIVDPELEVDWAFEGRDFIRRLTGDEALPGMQMIEVIILGLRNAGYSENQIWAALRSDSVCLATNKDGLLIPCYLENGEIVTPENDTEWKPLDSQIDRISPDWTRRLPDVVPVFTETADGGRAYTLTPTFAGPRDDKVISSHSVTLELRPVEDPDLDEDSDTQYYEVHGTVRIVYTQTADEVHLGADDFKGDRWVVEGDIFPIDPDNEFTRSHLMSVGGGLNPQQMNKDNASGDFTRTKFNADGSQDFQVSFTGHFSGTFNESLTQLEHAIIGDVNGPGLYGIDLGSSE